MSESKAFSLACEELERSTSFDRLEARGTVRLALKQAGLDAATVTAHQMGVVLTELMPTELESRGVSGGAAICATIKRSVSALPDEGTADAPETVFARLGGVR